jgi:hypothetical protein
MQIITSLAAAVYAYLPGRETAGTGSSWISSCSMLFESNACGDAKLGLRKIFTELMYVDIELSAESVSESRSVTPDLEICLVTLSWPLADKSRTHVNMIQLDRP